MALRRYEKSYKFCKVPAYPDVPYEEYISRINKARKLMDENNVDCLVLWSQKNIRYFFGYQSTHWLIPSIQCGVAVIPSKGDPVLVVPDFFIGTAENLCWVRNIIGHVDPHQQASQRELSIDIANLIKDMGYGNKNIGIENGDMGYTWIPRSYNDIKSFMDTLPEAAFVAGDKVIWGCRMIKSPLEVDRITKSIEAVTALEAALVAEFRPGMTEVDLSRIVQRKAGELGTSHLGDSMGVRGSFRAAADKEIMADIGVHEGAAITKGDYIFFDMFYDYKGYAADSGRMFQLEPITDEIKRMYELIWMCEDKVEEVLKPGIKAKELWKTMYDPIEAAGLPVLDMGGHGNGLDVHEPPSIDKWCDMEIKEGMVLSIEPWVYESFRINGGTGKYGVQDQFVVTKDGCQKISGLKREIIQVDHPIW